MKPHCVCVQSWVAAHRVHLALTLILTLDRVCLCDLNHDSGNDPIPKKPHLDVGTDPEPMGVREGYKRGVGS